MAIFLLAILTGAGVALLFLTRTDVRMSQASIRTKQAFYLAEAGIESGRLSLYATNRNGSFTDDLQVAAGANGALEIDPDAIRPVFGTDGVLAGFTGFGDDVPVAPMTRFGEGWYIAFLTNDPDEPDPFQFNTADGNERVMITGVAVGVDRSFEVAQAIVEMRQILPSIPPAAITLLGPSPYFHGGNSAAKKYVGDDCYGTGIPGLYVPTVGVIGTDAVASPCPADGDSVVCGLYQPGTYETGPYVGEDTVADVTDPGVIGGMGEIDPDWNDCRFLHSLVEEVRRVADVICPPGKLDACPNLPPSSPSRIIFVEGDIDVEPTISGEGLILATGELALDGNTSWNGMLLAIGRGLFSRYGAGNGVISGAIFVANISGPDDIFRTADDCSGGPAGFRQASFDLSGGGTGDDVFCTKDILGAFPVEPYPVVNFRQR
jgi:hypothetical protein